MNPAFVDIEAPEMRTLLDQARAGDAEAFGEVCRVYENRLLRQAVILCDNAATAEELAQDTLVEAWKCLRRYNGRCRFFTWLCAILLNRCRNVLRKREPMPISTFTGADRDETWSHIVNLPDQRPRPDQATELQEQAALVWECIRTLPLKHQQAIYLRFYVDDSLEEIASALGCPVGTVKSRLYHALEKLRSMNVLVAQLADLKTKKGGAL